MALFLFKNDLFNHWSCQSGIKLGKDILLSKIELHSP